MIENELNSFIKAYQENPFEFLTEYDIQSYVWCKLFHSFERNNIKVTIETTQNDIKVKKYNPDLKISINPVRREYPSGETFDIAIIDKKSVIKRYSGFWHQPLLAALEFKYHRSSKDGIFEMVKKFQQDIDKLRHYKEQNMKNPFYGIAILFLQNASPQMEKHFEEIFNTYELTNKIHIKDGISGYIVTKNHIFGMSLNH